MFIEVKSSTKTPQYKTRDSAGADVYAAEDVIIGVGETKVVKTSVYLELNKFNLFRSIALKFLQIFSIYPEVQVRARSGLAAKGVVVANGPGTVDADYPDEIGVILHNYGKEFIQLKAGDRCGQLVGGFVFRLKACSVSSDKRTGGFGSTGMKG